MGIVGLLTISAVGSGFNCGTQEKGVPKYETPEEKILRCFCKKDENKDLDKCKQYFKDHPWEIDTPIEDDCKE